MSLPLLPTLEEIRDDVAIRSGAANSGTLPQAQKRWLDSEIRRAQRELFSQYAWLRRNASTTITLSAGVKVYDLPNIFNLGGIHRVGILESDGIRVRSLLNDDLQDVTNEFTANGTPRYWKVMGAQIAPSPSAPPTASPQLVITPAPTSEWTTLVIEGQLRDYPVEADDDRVVVDGEAIIQAVTIRYKEYLGIGGDQGRNRQDLGAYIQSLRGQESTTKAYPIASRKNAGPAYWSYPSNSGSYAPYTPTWTPW